MLSTRRFDSQVFRRPAGWLAMLLLAVPAASFAQSAPAVSTIVSFSSSQSFGAPVFGPDGALYGATAVSTNVTGGIIYRAAADGSSIETLYQLTLDDGYSPVGGLILGSDGRLYGTNQIGAINQTNTTGTVFSIRPDGTDYTTLHRFQTFTETNQAGSVVNADGSNPETELVEGNDGFLYGVTRSGGVNGTGVVFKVSREGTGFAVVHAFGPITSVENVTPVLNADGLGNKGPLIAGADDYFYGTAAEGGPNGSGTVYRVRFDGSGFEVLHAFSRPTSDGTSTLPTNADGATPLAGLTDGGDGRLYGVANLGGASGNGTLFAIDPVGGLFTKLHDFDGFKGARPVSELLLAEDGRLYGTTATGGTNAGGDLTSFGTIFAISRDGTGFTSLISLDGSAGSSPAGRLLQVDATTFIGLAQGGGRCGQGTIYQFSLTGETVDGIDDCGQRRNSSGGGTMTPAWLLLLGVFGFARRWRMH